MSEFIRGMLKVVLGEALLPTGKNLPQAMIACVCILIINILLTLFELPKLFSLGGCVLALVILICLIIIERSEYSAVSKMYNDVGLRIKDVKGRYEAISSSIKSRGAVTANKQPRKNARNRADENSDHTDEDDGLVVFCGRGTEE